MDRDAPSVYSGNYIFLNPTYAYSCNFGFDGKVMDMLLTCLQRMAYNQEARKTICDLEMYRNTGELLDFAK